MRLMMQITPTCQEITGKISESIDHPVSCPDKIRIRLHLMTCSLCRRYRNQLIQITRLVSGLPETTDHHLSEEVKEKIKSDLQNEFNVGNNNL